MSRHLGCAPRTRREPAPSIGGKKRSRCGLSKGAANSWVPFYSQIAAVIPFPRRARLFNFGGGVLYGCLRLATDWGFRRTRSSVAPNICRPTDGTKSRKITMPAPTVCRLCSENSEELGKPRGQDSEFIFFAFLRACWEFF